MAALIPMKSEYYNDIKKLIIDELAVLISNTAARNLYLKCGYSKIRGNGKVETLQKKLVTVR